MRRFCLLAAAAALLWAVLVAATGGFALSLSGVRLSSRSATNPLLLAVLGGVAAWALSERGRRGETLAQDLRIFGGPLFASAVAIVIVVTGLVQGALVAGGADSYGYVSQADAWAKGTYRFDEPLIREFAGRVSRDALVPLGYQVVGEQGTVVPGYAPGLPMVMGLAQRLAGRGAVFYVVPLLGGIAILATYVIGFRVGGTAVGVSAAVLLATSPSFLFQLTAGPMSDVPVTAWWALALAALLFDGRGAACLAGCAASLAILTRPNLAPLALIPLVTLLSTAARERASSSRALQRALCFACGVVPGCVAVGVLNALWYGSPLMSGYGRPSDVYMWKNLGPNLLRYPAWVFESQSPIVLAALAGPWLVMRLADRSVLGVEARSTTLSWLYFILAVLASYLLYEAFNEWWFVRYMLPAFPPLLVLTAITIVAASARLSFWPRLVVPLALVVAAGWHGLVYARDHSVFDARSERKYAAAASYVARRLPANAVVVAMQHSGSLRYYSGRATVRWDLVPPPELDSTLAEFTLSGYRPYILLEPWEVPQFQKRYAGYSALAALDWPPTALMRESQIRIYDPADRESLAGGPPLTEIVP
jgi:hypothetical protein